MEEVILILPNWEYPLKRGETFVRVTLTAVPEEIPWESSVKETLL